MIIALAIAVVVLGLLALAHEYMILQIVKAIKNHTQSINDHTRAINDHTDVLRMDEHRIRTLEKTTIKRHI